MKRRFLLLVALLICSRLLDAQTISTSFTGAFTFFAAPAQIAFVVENTNATPMVLDAVEQYLEANANNSVWELYYSTTSLSGSGSPVPGPSWTLVATSSPVPVSGAGVTPVFAGLNFIIPANTQYRFVMKGIGPGNVTYVSASPTPNVNIFSAGGINLKVGDNQISGSNVGYSGNGTTLATTPRFWHGSIDLFPLVACTTPPTAGHATVSNATPCALSSINFNLTGVSFGSGQTYDWESATSLSGPYTSVSGPLTSPYYPTTSPTSPGTTYYRAAVTCSGITSYSDTTSVSVLAPLSGIYTINAGQPASSTNFQSFTNAMNLLKCAGITGPVVFNVAQNSGPYIEQLIIDSIAGASSGNTITIHGNGNIVRYAGATTAGLRATVLMNGADYVTLDSLNIEATDATYGWGVHLTNGADNDTIKNCSIVISSTSTTQASSAGIVVSGTGTSVTTDGNSDDITILNNTISGAYQGIILNGGIPNSQNNVIWGNSIKDFYSDGIAITQNSAAIISNNDIKRDTRVAVTTFTGIELGADNQQVVVDANRIHDTHNAATTQSGAAYGVHVTGCDVTPGLENIISNNLIYNFNSATGIQNALRNTGSDGTLFYHNTVVLDYNNSTAGATYPFYQTTAATNIDVKNNIFYVKRSGTGTKHCIYLATTASAVTTDYNDLYMSAPAGTNYIGRVGGVDHATFSAWQGVGYDVSGDTLDPIFTNPVIANYEPTNPLIDNRGTPVASVVTDMFGNPRDPSTPDVGAIEFIVPICITPPTAGTVVVSDTLICNGTSVSFDLLGNSTGLTQTFTWEAASSLSGPFAAVSSPDPLSLFTTSITSTAYYRAAVTCSGNTRYSDTVLVTVRTPLPGGTYTVNSAVATGGNNYQTLAEAAEAVKCGTTASVIFDVAPGSGPYTDSVYLGNIPNTSASNTITFNGNGTTLEINTANTNERAGFKLDGADFITINNFIIKTNTASTYAFSIQLMNDADDNTISNNIIYNDTTVTGTGHAGIVISTSATSATGGGNTGCDNNQIINNTIDGGYYGITLVAAAATPMMNNIVRGNTITNFYTYGLYAVGNNGAIVDSNDFSRPTRSNVNTFYGVYFATSNINSKINANRIHNSFDGEIAATVASYGIYFSSSDATSGNENIVSNNLIYNMNNSGGTGVQYGIYNAGSDYVKYYHNTISLDDATATCACDARGFYQTTGASGIEFVNNIVTVTRGGTGDKHGIYLNTPLTITNGIVLDHNDYYVNSAGGNNFVGYKNATNSITLLDWQNATTQESNSISVDPQYTSVSAGNLTPAANIDNLGLAVNISTDVTGAARSLSTPDMGAYEFFIPVCIAPPTAGTALISPTAVCSGVNVSFDLSGNSSGVGQTYVWESSTNINGPYSAITSPAPLSGYNGAIPGTGYFRAAVTCSGITTYSDTVLVTVYSGLSGNYTINNNAPTTGTNFSSFTDAVTAMNCGIVGPVVLDVVSGSGPYNEQIILDSAKIGTNSANTLTINGNGARLTYAATASTDPHTLQLNGIDFVSIHDLIIEGTGATYALSCHLWNQTDNDSFVNCTFIAPSAGTATTLAPFSISGSATSATGTGKGGNNNIITGCTMIGGYYSASIVGGTTVNIATGNQLLNCNLKEFYTYGSYNSYQNGVVISKNIVERPTRTDIAAFYGVYITTGCTNSLIEKNIMRTGFAGEPTGTNACYGVYCSIDATAGNENKIVNNLVYNMEGNGSFYGLYLTGADYVHAYYNTIVFDNAAATSGFAYGIYSTGTVGGIDIKNNNVYITRGGSGTKYCLYYTGAGSKSSDYNNLYINVPAGTNGVGYDGAAKTTLAAWQASTGAGAPYDVNSSTVDPVFTSTTDFTPTNFLLNNTGTSSTNIVDDIVDVARDINTPDIGAYEWTPVPCTTPPVAGTVTVTDTAVCAGNSVTFDLVGNSIGFPQTYQWESAPSLAGPFSPAGSSSLFTPYATTVNTTAYYRAAVTCSGNTQYSDTIRVSVRQPLPGGTYTVNSAFPTLGTNFNSLQEAAEAMSCGISGPIVINVGSGSGPYVNQQMVFPASLVTSSVNTITINGNNTTLTSNSSDPNQRAAIAFYGTDYVTVNDLTIDASTGAYNWGIFFTQGADHNKINNCTIISSKTVTASATADAIVFSASNTAATTQGNNGNYDTLINNTIIGGYYGVAMYGDATTPTKGNAVINNISQDAYAYSILVVANDSALVSGNDVSRPTRTNSTTYAGIYLNLASKGVIIEKNRIHNIADATTASFTAYCIYNNAADATAASPNIVRNNAIYNIQSQGTLYGIYNLGSDYISYFNNTISLDDISYAGTSATAGFYQSTAASGVDFRNNIISVTRGGTGDKHGVLFNTLATTTNPLTIDYNNYYVKGAVGNNFVGGITTNDYPTLNTWAIAITDEANSDTLNPYFTNTLIGDLSPTNFPLDNQGTPIAGITTDILNAPRSVTTPDMGAFEFVAPACPPPTQLTVGNVTATSATVTWAYVNNNAPAIGYEYYYSTSSTTPALGTLISGSGSTGNSVNLSGLTGTTTYYMWVRSICSAIDTSAWSQPVILKTLPVNDSARNATLLVVGTSSCNGVNYNGDVASATLEPGEPITSCEQTTGTASSVWYKFDAPASGMVRISTDYTVTAYDSLVDSKIGVYSVVDSSDFATYQIIGCDDDNGIVGTGYRNILYLSDLTPGNRYYIKVDKNNPSNPDAAFCIDVVPMTSAMISMADNCGGTGYSNNSNWHNGKQAWVSLLDATGLLIYNMKTNANTTALGAMPNEFYEQTGTSRDYLGTPYLNRNFKITSATAPASPVTLQFFFTDADFLSLQAANPAITMSDLNVTRLTSAACANTFNPTAQTATLLTQLANGEANGVRYINVQTPGFSSFFIHTGANPLVIRLGKIAAVNVGNDNRIDWNTMSEETGDRFELERSLDGRNFDKIADVNAKGQASVYSYLDKNASKGINYYRLKMFDNTNEFVYSQVVKAIVNADGVFVVEAFPNPVNEKLTVRITGKQATNPQVQVQDVTGKLIQQIKMNSNEELINMGNMANGVYLIKYVDDNHTQTIRVTKE